MARYCLFVLKVPLNPKQTNKQTMSVAQMFYSLVDTEWAASAKLQLVGLVCYYGHHYSTFFFHSKMKIWILFDDSHVRKVVQRF